MLFLALLSAPFAPGTTIFLDNGAEDYAAGYPLGPYYGSSADDPGVGAAGWTQTTTFDDVTISTWLSDNNAATSFNYYLVTAIGSSANSSDIVAQGSVSVPATGYSEVEILSLASLGPGTYYLVLDSSTADTFWLYQSNPAATAPTLGPGVTFKGDYSARGTTDVNSSKQYASTFFTEFSGYDEFDIDVEGTLATPEPATFALVGAAMCALILLRRRY